MFNIALLSQPTGHGTRSRIGPHNIHRDTGLHQYKKPCLRSHISMLERVTEPGLNLSCMAWLGIGFLVKTFNKEGYEEIDINEVIKLLEDGDDSKLEELSS